MREQLEYLHVWNDHTPHLGEANMQIDAQLLQNIEATPILRLYRWAEPTITYGYFSNPEAAKARFGNDITYVRRRTGGGIVDHRHDLTYTLILPKTHPWAQLKGSGSYALIHHAVAVALHTAGVPCQLIDRDSGNGDATCFDNPVAYDIIDPHGNKLAGAGQRRSRHGLLHQGSIQASLTLDALLAPLANALAGSWQMVIPDKL